MNLPSLPGGLNPSALAAPLAALQKAVSQQQQALAAPLAALQKAVSQQQQGSSSTPAATPAPVEDTLLVLTTPVQLPNAADGTPGAQVYAWAGHLDSQSGVFTTMEPAAYLTIDGQSATAVGSAPPGLTPGHYYQMSQGIVGKDLGPVPQTAGGPSNLLIASMASKNLSNPNTPGLSWTYCWLDGAASADNPAQQLVSFVPDAQAAAQDASFLAALAPSFVPSSFQLFRVASDGSGSVTVYPPTQTASGPLARIVKRAQGMADDLSTPALWGIGLGLTALVGLTGWAAWKAFTEKEDPETIFYRDENPTREYRL